MAGQTRPLWAATVLSIYGKHCIVQEGCESLGVSRFDSVQNRFSIQLILDSKIDTMHSVLRQIMALTHYGGVYLSMVTLCYIRNENFSHEMRNSTTLIAQSAAEWKKQALKECVLTRWIWVLKKLLSLCLEGRCWLHCVWMLWPAPSFCALLFDIVPAVHSCPYLHS